MSWPVFRTTSLIFFSRAKFTPATTSAIFVAFTVYLGWSPIEHVPAGAAAVWLPFGHVSVGRSAIVHGEPAVALMGGHDPVG